MKTKLIIISINVILSTITLFGQTGKIEQKAIDYFTDSVMLEDSFFEGKYIYYEDHLVSRNTPACFIGNHFDLKTDYTFHSVNINRESKADYWEQDSVKFKPFSVSINKRLKKRLFRKMLNEYSFYLEVYKYYEYKNYYYVLIQLTHKDEQMGYNYVIRMSKNLRECDYSSVILSF